MKSKTNLFTSSIDRPLTRGVGIEQVRALLGHQRIDTTQIYTSIRPAHLKRAVSFYEEKAVRMLSE